MKTEKVITEQEKDQIIHDLIDKLDFTLTELSVVFGEEHLDIEMYLAHLIKIFKHKKRKG